MSLKGSDDDDMNVSVWERWRGGTRVRELLNSYTLYLLNRFIWTTIRNRKWTRRRSGNYICTKSITFWSRGSSLSKVSSIGLTLTLNPNMHYFEYGSRLSDLPTTAESHGSPKRAKLVNISSQWNQSPTRISSPSMRLKTHLVERRLSCSQLERTNTKNGGGNAGYPYRLGCLLG